MHHSNWQNLFLSMKSMQEGLAEYYITRYQFIVLTSALMVMGEF